MASFWKDLSVLKSRRESGLIDFSFGKLSNREKNTPSKRNSIFKIYSPSNFIKNSHSSYNCSLKQIQSIFKIKDQKSNNIGNIFDFPKRDSIDKNIQNLVNFEIEQLKIQQEKESLIDKKLKDGQLIQNLKYQEVAKNKENCQMVFNKIEENLEQMQQIAQIVNDDRIEHITNRKTRTKRVKKTICKPEVVNFMKQKLFIIAESIIQFQLRQKADRSLDFYSFALKQILNENKKLNDENELNDQTYQSPNKSVDQMIQNDENEDNQMNQNNDENNFKCKFCGKVFEKGCALGGHISKMHKGVSYHYKFRQKRREVRNGERLRNKFIKKFIQFHLNPN